MSIAAGATLYGRKLAERLMESTCSVVRRTSTVDEVSGVDTIVDTPVWSGPCRLRFPFVRPSEQGAAAQVFSEQRGILSVPVEGTSGILTNDIVVVTGSSLDAGLVGQELRVQGPFFETHATARRLPVQVVS